MSDERSEIEELKRRVAELEGRPVNSDLDWLRTSNVWKLAQFSANPRWIKFNVIGIILVFAIFITLFVAAGIQKHL